MKKTLCMIALLALVPAAWGQRKISVTPQAGINYPYLAGSDFCSEFKGRPGYAIGAEVEGRVSSLLGLSVGAFYSKHVVKINQCAWTGIIVDVPGGSSSASGGGQRIPGWGGGMSYSFGSEWPDVSHYDAYTRKYNYRFCTQLLDIPLLANLHVWKGLTVKAGLQVSFALSNKMKYDSEYVIRHPALEAQYWHPMNEYVEKDQTADLGDHLSDVMLYVPLGISYEYKHLVVDLRYAYGLSHYGTTEHFNGSDKKNQELTNSHGIFGREIEAAHDSRLHSLTVTLGYRFDL